MRTLSEAFIDVGGAAHTSFQVEQTPGHDGSAERLAEMSVVLMVGAKLAYAKPLPAVWWFVPLLFLVLRPLLVVASTWGSD